MCAARTPSPTSVCAMPAGNSENTQEEEGALAYWLLTTSEPATSRKSKFRPVEKSTGPVGSTVSTDQSTGFGRFSTVSTETSRIDRFDQNQSEWFRSIFDRFDRNQSDFRPFRPKRPLVVNCLASHVTVSSNPSLPHDDMLVTRH